MLNIIICISCVSDFMQKCYWNSLCELSLIAGFFDIFVCYRMCLTVFTLLQVQCFEGVFFPVKKKCYIVYNYVRLYKLFKHSI